MTNYVSGDVVTHPVFGVGVILSAGHGSYRIDFSIAGIKEVSRSAEDLRKLGTSGTASLKDIFTVLRSFLSEEAVSDVENEIGDRWIGGSVILKPGVDETKSKEIPIDKFLYKIILVRERLRVLEQKLNNHPKLSENDKVELQQYITRCYGSLTTFNVLFKHRKSWFRGESGKGGG